MPIAKIKLVIAGYLNANPIEKSIAPILPEKIANLEINLDISRLRGDYSVDAREAKLAIWPIKVLSPVNITNPFPLPSLLSVEKNAMFLDYRGFSGQVH